MQASQPVQRAIISNTMNHFKTKMVAIGIAALALFGVAGIAYGASYFSATVQTSAATSTPAYMTPGNATSTLTYNTLTNTSVATATPSGSQAATKAEFVYLAGQLTGSSTSAVIHITPEYSVDGIDWYQGYGLVVNISTTTPNPTYAYGTVDSINLPYASTTVGGLSASSVDRFLVKIPVPTKDVRLVVTLTGANAAFWGQIVPIKNQ